MLTRKNPQQSEDNMKRSVLHVSQEPLSVHGIDPSMPIALYQMTLKLLNKI